MTKKKQTGEKSHSWWWWNWSCQPDSRVLGLGGWAGILAGNGAAPYWAAEKSRRANILETLEPVDRVY